MKLIALGDNCIDYYHNTGEAFPGGNAINVAVHAAQQGAEAEYLGVFADDEPAEILKNSLKKQGVRFDDCPCRPGTTTKICSYDVVEGERSFLEVITGDHWAGPVQIDEAITDALKSADIIVSGCNAKIVDRLLEVQELPAVFAFDFGEKEKYQTPEYYDQVCGRMDLAMFSMKVDSEDQFRKFCEPLHERGVVHVLATMGSKGQIISNGSAILKMRTHIVEACDTMGAGDSFLAAFVCDLMRSGWKKGERMTEDLLKKALENGQRVSARNCMNQGGFGAKISFPLQLTNLK